ncbi:hypothetical protein HGRIS_012083 [Hohenbuehelia grisea]
MARIAASGRIFREPNLLSDQVNDQDQPIDALRPSTAYLQSLPVIHDGDPQDGSDEDDLADWCNYDSLPVLRVDRAALTPAVLTENIKVVAFDSNVFIDRHGPLKKVLISIFPRSRYLRSERELFGLYIEYEALRVSEGQPESPLAVIRNIAHYLDAEVDDSAITVSIQDLLRPRIATESTTIPKFLAEEGFISVAIPSTASGSSVASIDDLALGLFDIIAQNTQNALSWDAVLSFCEEYYPNICRSQILVVSGDLRRICESASQAGFPTTFLAAEKDFNGRPYKFIPTIAPTYTLTDLAELLPVLRDPKSAPPPPEPLADMENPPFRIRNTYQCTYVLGTGSFSYVWNAIQLDTGFPVAIKFEQIDPTDPSIIPYEAAIYSQLEGVQGIPRVHWSGKDTNADVLVMDKLGPNLESLRRFCRGRLELKTVLMLGEQMLQIIEQVHARGIIIRDVKPENCALGFAEDYKRLFLFDLGLAKLYLNPNTGVHMPFREGRAGIGTPRYASHNVHLGFEPGRRDDVEAIGMLLLYLLHGRLPWQGIYAPDIPAKLRRIGEMKRGQPFTDLLALSPTFFAPFFSHCRSLEFSDKPDYKLLRGLLRGEMRKNGWEYDWEYDWWKAGKRGTLLPEEYQIDPRWVEPIRRQMFSY